MLLQRKHWVYPSFVGLGRRPFRSGDPLSRTATGGEGASSALCNLSPLWGIRKKTPRPMAAQADPKVQEEWKEKNLAAALKEAGVTRQTVLVWADEMGVGLYGQTRRVWVPRG